MAIEYKKNRVLFREVATVEEAEQLLEWMQGRPEARIDLRACTHMHAAVLQVLMASSHRITTWPNDATLRGWLETALKSG